MPKLTKKNIITKEKKICSEPLSLFKKSIARQGIITTERQILLSKIIRGEEINPEVKQYEAIRPVENALNEKEIGIYRNVDKRKSVTADMEIIKYYFDCLKKPCPSFLEAGPRKYLYFNPKEVRIGIVTPGGIAPGLNTVVNCIVNMHEKYGMSRLAFGFKGGFRGIAKCDTVRLNSTITHDRIHKGGTDLCTSRGKQKISEMVDTLQHLGINILYVVGGDGSLNGGHLIAKYIEDNNITVGNEKIVIVGIPKTMDNDILWVWHSFGFDTAVEEATKAINTIHDDAKSTERVCIMQLFGRDAGFVAAHAALASGQVDAVLVPEIEFKMEPLIKYIKQKVRDKRYALIVAAEGAAPKEYTDGFIYEILRREGYKNPKKLPKTHPRVNKLLAEGKLIYLREEFEKKFMKFIRGRHVVFDSQPRHLIRAVPAGSVDQIYCQRLADLAVHNALAGFTDFMISQWLTEYVLIPLKLVCEEADPNNPDKRLTKKIVPDGIFWATVISSTGQPSFID
jgi:6-phosphofructokinase 1